MTDKVEMIFAALFAAWLLGVLWLIGRFLYDLWATGREIDRSKDGLDLGDK